MKVHASILRYPLAESKVLRALLTIFLACLLWLGLGSPQAQAAQEPPAIRVACVGDSITEGNGNVDYLLNAWPLILDRMLSDQTKAAYDSRNFGRSGATLLRKGRKPYWDQDVFAASKQFQPQIVIINLGTNDAVHGNWSQHGGDFEQDYRDLIQVYQALDSKPQIFLSNLTPMIYPHPRLEECAPNRIKIEAIIDSLAQEFDLEVIDFKTPLVNKHWLLPDGLHPNTVGNEQMALAAFYAITGKHAKVDQSLRPKAIPGRTLPLVSRGRAVKAYLGTWQQEEGWVEGTGSTKNLVAKVGLGEGDFHIRARLRMKGQKNCAAGFVLGNNFFGFEGNTGRVFRNGGTFGGLRLQYAAETMWERDSWINFDVVRNGDMVWWIVNGFVLEMAQLAGPIERLAFDPNRSQMQLKYWSVRGNVIEHEEPQLTKRTVDIPWIDLTTEFKPQRWSRFGSSLTIKSPDGSQQVELLPLQAFKDHAMVLVPPDNHPTGTDDRPLAVSVSGRYHDYAYLPDGRLLITMLDTHPDSATFGDFVAWVGRYEDLLHLGEGDFTIRLYRFEEQPGPTALGPEVVVDAELLAAIDKALPTRGYDIPIVDLNADVGRHVVVDREKGQYLGHVSTTLLDDGKTILAVYPKGHGRGPIVYKRSEDAGLTWSERLPTPESWATSKEVPTIHQVVDPKTGHKRLIMWSGLHPARLAVSEDEGGSWSELEPVGEWGGIVVMGFVERLLDGRYLAMFHDDGRFFTKKGRGDKPAGFTLYKTFSHDGGLNWTYPEEVWKGNDIHLCEPGSIRSPDGKTLAVLLRENSRKRNSFIIFSEDEGHTWTAPRELPASLTGDRHTGKYTPDGRLFLTFRDTAHESITQGDWVGWVGTWEDLANGWPGQYRVRIKDNKHRWDTTYPGLEVLADGTIVTTTYGHWVEGEQPYILSARFTLEELDRRAALLPTKTTLFERGQGGVHTYRIPALVTTNQGTLIAACDARIHSSRDLPNNIDTVLRRSADGGETWSPIKTVIDWSGEQGAADPSLVVDRQTGRIWCAVTWSESVNWRDAKPGFGRDTFHNLLVHSDDDGLTWSEPVDITESLKDPAWRSVWFSPGSGIQSTSGRLFLPFSAADADGADSSWAAISDDHGKTWSRVGPIGTKTNESMIAQLADGTLVCNLRSRHGKNQRGVSFSRDDGATWSSMKHHAGLPEPVCQASLLTVPAERTPDDREWLVFCNPNSIKREDLTIKISFDGGNTWPIVRLLHAGPTAYSCMTVLPQGGLGVLYERGAKNSYEGISFAALPWHWLMEDGRHD
ncbi:MAG: exo-alpha-sialidase [Planctomycetota bacterium]|jgi:lysophospholipase L1-like esterase|nr:exo-alpha-sialidase [Planctomycetota bacterium]